MSEPAQTVAVFDIDGLVVRAQDNTRRCGRPDLRTVWQVRVVPRLVRAGIDYDASSL